MGENLKVLIFGHEKTAYTNYLIDALTGAGVKVLSPYWPFPWHFWGKGLVWHLHWPSFYYKLRPSALFNIISLLAWIYFVFIILPSVALSKIPLVYTMHNLYPHERHLRFMDKIARRRVLSLAHTVVLNCQRARTIFQKEFPFYQGSIQIIPHGSLQRPSEKPVSQREARQRLGLPQDAYVYLHVGKLRLYKGIEELVSVFRLVAGAKDLLLIVGEPANPGYAGRLKYLVQDSPQVRLFLGFTPDDQLSLYLCSCNCLVLPYRQVMTSGAALLALAWSKPAVVPSAGCLPEQLGAVGVYYGDEGLPSLGDAMQAVKQIEPAIIAKEARVKFAQVSWENLVPKLQKVYACSLSRLP
jgi:glycosyltransferase involved in cell wall biosynthesis